MINPGRAAYVKDGKVNVVDYDVSDVAKIRELAKAVGIRKTPADYFKHKDALIMAEALEKTSNAQEAFDYYVRKLQEELARDQLFRQGFEENLQKEMVKIYNLAATMKPGEEVMHTLPAYIVTITNRMIASTVRRLPLLGDAATIQYEAVATLSETDNKLSDKVESAIHLYYSLSSLLLNTTVEEIKEQRDATTTITPNNKADAGHCRGRCPPNLFSA